MYVVLVDKLLLVKIYRIRAFGNTFLKFGSVHINCILLGKYFSWKKLGEI